MCRIAYVPHPALLEVGDFTDLFSYLEKSVGGHGNGLATVIDGSIKVFKGVRLDVKVLANIAAHAEGPVLFHTRRATTGGICNALCQPFVGNGTALVHNGIWRDWADPAMELILQGSLDANAPINDSLTAAVLVANYGRYTLEAINSGVFVVMTTKGAWLHLRQGTFKYCEELAIYASDFPKEGWPIAKSFGDDVVAYLGGDAPVFECGGWWTARRLLYAKYAKGAPRPIVHHQPAWEEDDDDELDKLAEKYEREDELNKLADKLAEKYGRAEVAYHGAPA